MAKSDRAVLRPMTEDGGIIVPQDLPQIKYADLCGKEFEAIARTVIGAFTDCDIELDRSEFDDEPTAVVKPDDNLFLVELWHGKTRTAQDVLRAISDKTENSRFDREHSDNNKSDIAYIAALTVCFFSAYCDLVDNGEIEVGQKADFASSADSFEFVLAGWYARRMGLPINRLLCACDTDGALYDFLRTGEFDLERDKTVDDALTDNLLRLIYDVNGNSYFAELKSKGRFSVTPDEIERIRETVSADYASEKIADEVICDLFDDYGYVADPDTAIAYAAAAEREFIRPAVVISSRDPFLSAARVMNALGEKNVPPDKMLDRMEEITASECSDYIRRLYADANTLDMEK